MSHISHITSCIIVIHSHTSHIIVTHHTSLSHITKALSHVIHYTATVTFTHIIISQPDTDVVGKEIKNKSKFRKRKEEGGEKGEETLEHLCAL